jgi:pimeloyl-ACP methyl ester carboxylesterase
MPSLSRRLKLPDGRQLSYAEFGNPQGMPAIYCHGFPGSRLEAGLFEQAAVERQLRIIAPERNGLGRSEPKPGRRLLDWASDVEVLVEQLRLREFYLIGISGGAPYALACARHFGNRLKGFTLVCPLGPVDEPALLHAMRWPARINFKSIRRMPQVWDFAYRFSIVPLAQLWPQWIYQTMLLMVPEADRQVLRKSEVRQIITSSLREAIRQGAQGVLQEMALYAQPWEFSLSEVDIPVQLWHGTLDETVPMLHAETLAARLPMCETHFVDDEGHFSLPIRRAGQILDRLIAPQSGIDAATGVGSRE